MAIKYLLAVDTTGFVAEIPLTDTGILGALALNTPNPDSKAILEMVSTSKGMLPPRMTEAQRDAIAKPIPEGLTIYNLTSHVMNTWDGIKWTGFAGFARVNSWSMTVTPPAAYATSLAVKGVQMLVVDWGDGTTVNYTDDTATSVNHTYVTAGTYTLKLSGLLSPDGYVKPSPLGGALIATSVIDATFSDFSSMFRDTGLTAIPTGIFDKCPNATTFSFCFTGCWNLASAIPPTLFTNTRAATKFDNLFNGCYLLSGSIPANLFANCVPDTIYTLFGSCQSLTGTIPANLFATAGAVTSCFNIFIGCTSLTGPIPSGLFAAQVNVTNYQAAFSGCGITSIPDNLFANSPHVTDFSRTFFDCKSLSTVGANVFVSDVAFDNYNLFYGCTALQTISGTAFAAATKCTSWTSAFEGCTALQAVPNNLFGNNTACTSYDRAFYGCTALTTCGSNAFGSLVNFSFVNVFTNSSLTTINAAAFTNATKVTSMAGAFTGITTLNALPAGLFATMTACTNFSTAFKNCTGLLTIPDTLFQNCGAATNYTGCFEGCLNITAAIGVNFFNLTAPTTTFARCFYNCQNMSGTTPDLWTAYPAADGTKCFFNCFTVTNFNSIPLAWGGRPTFTVNTDVLVDIPFMYADLQPNTKYFVHGVVRIIRNSGSNALRIAFTVPTGASVYIGTLGMVASTSVSNQDIISQSGVESQDAYMDGQSHLTFHGSVITGAIAGKLQLQMKVATLPTSSTVQADSRLEVVEDANMPVLAADFTTTSTTNVPVPGQAVALQPFKTYRISLVCALIPQGGTTTMAFTVPVNAVIAVGFTRVGADTIGAGPTIAWGPLAGTTASSNNHFLMNGFIKTGDTGGNIQMQLKSTTGFTALIQAGALLSVVEAPNSGVVTTDFNTTSGVLVDVPPLTATVQAGKLYRVYAEIGYNTSSLLTAAFRTPSASPKEMFITAMVQRIRTNAAGTSLFRIAAPSPGETNTFSSGSGADAAVGIFNGYIRASQSGNVVFQTRNADATPTTTVTIKAGSGIELQEIIE
jgi:hypothetical protein